MSIRKPDPIDKHIGGRIRMRRLELSLTQELVADGLNVSFQQVQKYEKGVNRVGGSRMAALARILDVEISFFYQDAPGSKRKRGATVSLMDQFVTSREGVVIAQAFVRIANPSVRAAIAHFVRTLGESDAARLQPAE
jgi:transcriptional regulator with XRE-family HTH domain